MDKCTQSVPKLMPKQPETRRKTGGYIARQTVKDLLDVVGWLSTNVDTLMTAESPMQKQTPYIQANKNLREMSNMLHELNQTLNNKTK